ncbi:MAG: HAMP domain-containing sensor histidine kinase [Planctomycetota bacterium]
MASGPTRAFQIAFLVLLVVCIAQVAWWILDEGAHSRDIRDRFASLYQADAAAGEALLASGVPAERVEELMPHLAADSERGALVRPEVLAELYEERNSRLNQYGWEGSFFLLVLLAGMGVILQALRQSTALMQRQQNFLASVSHELKSPLASLKLSAETLLLRKPDAEGTERLAGRMVRDADRLETLVSNLLEVTRLEEGDAAPRPHTQPLLPLVHAAVEQVRPNLEPGVELQLAVPDGLTVHADPEAFRSCVRNLLTNAGKSVAATPSSAGEVRLAVRAAEDAHRIELTVTDEGLGFERAEAARLFDKFYRPGDEMRRRTKGSGLGLYIAKSHAKSHGGSIEAFSDGPGRGAVFTLRWPSEDPRS